MKMAEHVNLCGNTGYTVYNGHSLDTENLHGEPWKLMPLFAQTVTQSPPPRWTNQSYAHYYWQSGCITISCKKEINKTKNKTKTKKNPTKLPEK